MYFFSWSSGTIQNHALREPCIIQFISSPLVSKNFHSSFDMKSEGVTFTIFIGAIGKKKNEIEKKGRTLIGENVHSGQGLSVMHASKVQTMTVAS